MNYEQALALKGAGIWSQIESLSLLAPKITHDPVAVYGILSSFDWSHLVQPMGVPFCQGLPAILINSGNWELQFIVYRRETFKKVAAFMNHAISVFASTNTPNEWVGIHELPENKNGIAIYQRINNIKFNEALQHDPTVRNRLKQIWQPRAMCRDYDQLLTNMADKLRTLRANDIITAHDIQQIIDDVKYYQSHPDLVNDRPISGKQPLQDDPSRTEQTHRDAIETLREVLPELMNTGGQNSKEVMIELLHNISTQWVQYGAPQDPSQLIEWLLQQNVIQESTADWMIALLTSDDVSQQSQRCEQSSHATTSKSARQPHHTVIRRSEQQPSSVSTRELKQQSTQQFRADVRRPIQRPSHAHQPSPTSRYYESSRASTSHSIGPNSPDAAIVEYIETKFRKTVPIVIIQAIKNGQYIEAYNRGIADILRDIGFRL